MESYYALRERVLAVAREVEGYSPGKVEQVIEEIEGITDPRIKRRIRELEFDICEDRRYCEQLGVDYASLRDRRFQGMKDLGINRIVVFSYYLTKENPDITLPLLQH